MDADVDWEGRLIGRLADVRVDQPYDRGTWAGAGVTELEPAVRGEPERIGPHGLGVLPVVFHSTGGHSSAPAAALIRPAPEAEPNSRIATAGLSAHVVSSKAAGWT